MGSAESGLSANGVQSGLDKVVENAAKARFAKQILGFQTARTKKKPGR